VLSASQAFNSFVVGSKKCVFYIEAKRGGNKNAVMSTSLALFNN
jgi:hypothetical protein